VAADAALLPPFHADAVPPEPELLANELGVAMLDGSDGLCAGALASALLLAVSFLPKRHQLLPEPDWQPEIPTAAASNTVERALENRIARAPCASLSKRAAAHATTSLSRGLSSLP
jgi:hypothetical protein